MRGIGRSFLKGFLIGVLCLCIVGLAGLFVLRPSLTAAEADALKRTYSEAGPGADRSGALPAGEEPASFVDFSSLRADYPDVKGWLTIPGTVVDYPVLQSSAAQPEYYLRRNYRGEWRMAGSLFFQYDCTLQSKNTVIYGHNMTDGSMFGVLAKYEDDVFRKGHSRLLLQTEGGVEEYAVAAVLKTDAAQLPFNRTGFASDADYLSFAAELGVSVTSADERLLTLVTCAYDWDGARTVVVARRVVPSDLHRYSLCD